ncbi:MAG: hypothetical protein KatS3mg111_0300 [Pirellulaceae bacterium]|nr:MAG: hypothetical protein KatS3mg111_0300 [Pirellulaceae bacterium]
MSKSILKRLPESRQVAAEMAEVSRRLRQLRSVWRLLRRLEQTKPLPSARRTSGRPEGKGVADER